MTYQHWRLEQDNQQLLWLYFDKKNASVNSIDKEVMQELTQILTSVEQEKKYKGMIIASAKKQGFIAGADISQFALFKDAEEATALLQQGQAVFDQIEALSIPTVAMIEGFCLGGGTELALACRYRVAEDGLKTRIGLPEVKLGIHPGWGGTVRLPRLIGALDALPLILSGATVSAKAAAKLGIVDAAVPKRHLMRAAAYYALENPGAHQPKKWQSLLELPLVRPLIAAFMRKKLQAKANPKHYPAPFKVLDNWQQLGTGKGAMENEAKTCGELFFSETSKNLVHVFHLQERLKSLAKDKTFAPQHVHVIGAGTMGGDIAAWCAFSGFQVTLQDREPQMIAPAIKRAYQLFKEKLKEPHLIQKAMDALQPDVHGYGIAHADVIIEAVFEDLKTKQDIFKAVEKQAKKDAILATNTSSIPLDEINIVLENPERLIGIHFFNPVPKMLLVEVVKGKRSDASIIDKAISFVRKIDRLPLPVNSSPGFLVNRILMPYLLESMVILEEGIPAEVIDKAMTDFGMPMGPVALADTVGLDVCLSVANYLGKYLHTSTPVRLIKMVESGKLGKKSGEGFYQYKNGKPIRAKQFPSSEMSSEEISNRLVLRMIDEAFACLREQVIADPQLLDAGMIFGTGFAPFRGGLLHYAKSKGIHELFLQYERIQKDHGDKTEKLTPWEEGVEA